MGTTVVSGSASGIGAAVRSRLEDQGDRIIGIDVRDAEVEIDLSPLRPGPDGRARQHAVAGDVHYPDGDTGVLLLFKPSLVGDEPPVAPEVCARAAGRALARRRSDWGTECLLWATDPHLHEHAQENWAPGVWDTPQAPSWDARARLLDREVPLASTGNRGNIGIYSDGGWDPRGVVLRCACENIWPVGRLLAIIGRGCLSRPTPSGAIRL